MKDSYEFGKAIATGLTKRQTRLDVGLVLVGIGIALIISAFAKAPEDNYYVKED